MEQVRSDLESHSLRAPWKDLTSRLCMVGTRTRVQQLAGSDLTGRRRQVGASTHLGRRQGPQEAVRSLSVPGYSTQNALLQDFAILDAGQRPRCLLPCRNVYLTIASAKVAFQARTAQPRAQNPAFSLSLCSGRIVSSRQLKLSSLQQHSELPAVMLLIGLCGDELLLVLLSALLLLLRRVHPSVMILRSGGFASAFRSKCTQPQ